MSSGPRFLNALRLRLAGTIDGSRGRRVAATALVSYASRGLSIVTTLITYPLVLNGLGEVQFGLWAVISSLFVYLRLVDGGATVGYQVLVSQADGADARDRIRGLTANAYGLGALFFLGLALLSLAAQWLDWGRLLDLESAELRGIAANAVSIMCLGVGTNYPAQIVRQLRLARQQGAAANVWELAITLITFGWQLSVIWFGLGLVALVAVTALTPPLVNVVASAAYYLKAGRAWRPDFSKLDPTTVRLIFSAGAMFLGLAAAQAVSTQLDLLVISNLLGVEAVADYAILQKLFLQPQMLITILLTAQFPAYGEALTRGDFTWIVSSIRRTLLLSALAVVAICGTLGLSVPVLLELWLQNDAIRPDGLLVAAMVCFGIVTALTNVLVYFSYAIHRSRIVLLGYVAMAPLNAVLFALLIPRLGSAGAAFTLAIGMLTCLLIPGIVSLRSMPRVLPGLRSKLLARQGLVDGDAAEA